MHYCQPIQVLDEQPELNPQVELRLQFQNMPANHSEAKDDCQQKPVYIVTLYQVWSTK